MWYPVKDTLAIDGLFFNFLPSWWQANYGLVFGERFVFDADYRVELHRFMERTVFERFPGLHIGSPDPQPQVILPDFGNAITAAAAGCEVVYPDNNYPWNRHLPWDAVPALRLPLDLDQTFPYSEIEAQVHYLNRKLGKDTRPVWNSRGVLNDAALIGGPNFLAEFGAASPEAAMLEAYSFGMLRAVIQANHERFSYRDMVMLTNCTVMMVSPAMFTQRLFGYDQQVYQQVTRQGQKLGIHHCGSFEKYAPSYRRLPEIAWLEIGWGSDFRLTLDLFPEATIQYILSAVFVMTAAPAQVRSAIDGILANARLREGWRRFRLTMPDIDAGTPDENLYQIYTACKTAR